jgi:hypothetical protein
VEKAWENLGPAVRNGVLRYISVSQMESFDPLVYGGCERRWWFRRVARQKEEQSKPSELGEKVHAQIEHYLRHGKVDVLGPIPRAGLRFLPKPGPDLMLEWIFGTPYGENVVSPLVLAGVPLIGKADCAHARDTWLDDDGEPHFDPEVCEVDDWKTTARIHDEKDRDGVVIREGLAKSAAELADMHQMRAYAALAHMQWPEKKRIILAHGYFQSKWPHEALKRYKIVDAAAAQARFLEDVPLVEKMKWAATVKKVTDIEPNLRACSAYRGCPYKDQCPRSPSAVVNSIFNNIRTAPRGPEREQRMGLMERRKAAAAAAAVAPISEVASPPKEVAEEIEKLKAEERGESVTPPDEPAPEKVAEPVTSEVVATGAEGGPCSMSGQQVRLEDGAKAYTCSCGATLRVRAKKLADGTYAMVPSHTVGVSTSKSVAKRQEALSEEKPFLDGGPAAGPPDERPAVGFSLVLDAIIDGVPMQRLEAYAQAIADDLAKTCGAADIRSAPEKSSLAFGKWRGFFIAAVRENPPGSGSWVVSSTSELGMIAFDTLLGSADMVIRSAK